MLTQTQTDRFLDQGYVILGDAVEPRLMAPLREAAARVVRRTRSGEWKPRRATPDGDIWGVQDLLHPDLGEPVFTEYMASDPVLEVARDLLGSDLRMGLLNLLVNPERQAFAIGWHRDLLRQEVPPEQEQAELERLLREVLQWNTALYDDDCLVIVPGSHRRAASPEERDAQFRSPMEPLPHQEVVELKAGQGVYYNNMLIHRGIYPAGRPRATLHAALTPTTNPLRLYYDAVPWMAEPRFRATLPPPLLPLHDRWLEFARRWQQEDAAPKAD